MEMAFMCSLLLAVSPDILSLFFLAGIAERAPQIAPSSPDRIINWVQFLQKRSPKKAAENEPCLVAKPLWQQHEMSRADLSMSCTTGMKARELDSFQGRKIEQTASAFDHAFACV